MPPKIGTEIDIEAVLELGEKLRLSHELVAEILGVNVTTLWRWRRGEVSPRGLSRSRVAQFTELGDMLHMQFAGPDLARNWIKDARPKGLGGDRTPLEVMQQGRIDRVLTLLHFMANGA